MSLIPQSGPVKASLFCFLSGAIYLAIAPIYGKMCSDSNTNMGQTVLGVPAIVFTAVGLITIVGGTFIIISHFKDSNSRND